MNLTLHLDLREDLFFSNISLIFNFTVKTVICKVVRNLIPHNFGLYDFYPTIDIFRLILNLGVEIFFVFNYFVSPPPNSFQVKSYLLDQTNSRLSQSARTKG